MKLLSKEQIGRIEGRRDWLLAFDCACNHGYLRGVASSQLDEMQALYNEVRGTAAHLNKACPTCVFELVKSLGWLYYETRKTMETGSPVHKLHRTAPTRPSETIHRIVEEEVEDEPAPKAPAKPKKPAAKPKKAAAKKKK